MSKLTSIHAEIAQSFDNFRSSAVEYEYLARSLFDISLPKAAHAMANQDDAVPFLTANALRLRLAEQTKDPAEGWQTCLDFMRRLEPDVRHDPAVYAREQTDLSRNSLRNDVTRQAVTAMLFHGTDSDYTALPKAASYGFLWAYERNQYQNLDLTGKIIATFAVRNAFNIGMTGDYPYEIVHPALTFNSNIEAILVSYDLLAEPGAYRCTARNFLIKLMPENTFGVYEDPTVRDARCAVSDLPVKTDDYEQVAEINIFAEGIAKTHELRQLRPAVKNLLLGFLT